jgi:hypothetical protein
MALPAQHAAYGCLRRFARWMFINRRTGRVTVAQWPNVALWIFLVASLARQFGQATHPLETALRVLGTVALIVWSSDEIVRGVNPFRRMIGTGVLALTIAGLVG